MHAKMITHCLTFITSPLLEMDCTLAAVNHGNSAASMSAHDGVMENSVAMKFWHTIFPRIFCCSTLVVPVA